MDTPPIVHDFQMKLKQGQSVENDLDEHFQESYTIRKASEDEQRKGIDRVFTSNFGDSFCVEYKADWRASETGNAFLETVSVDTKELPGWVHTSEADWLVYAIPQQRRYLLVPFKELRQALPVWVKKYPCGTARNDAYFSHGVLVPLSEFERVSHYVSAY